MQFKALFVFALPVAVLAAPAPIQATAGSSDNNAADLVARKPVVDTAGTEHSLEARQTVQEQITTVVTQAIKDAVTALAVEGAQKAGQFIKDVKNWTSAREDFTKTTSKEMWSKNPDTKKYAAAICYNMGYKVDNTAGVAGKISAQLKTGLLKTDYDCFYMTAPNVFTAQGDGGYINLSITSDSRCNYDSKTKVLRCT